MKSSANPFNTTDPIIAADYVGNDPLRNEAIVRESFVSKAKRYLNKVPLAQETVAMYFAVLDAKTPVWVKATAGAALAYFILPIDAIPDMIPLVGFSDDAGVLAAALSAVSSHVTDEHRARARDWMSSEQLEPSHAEPVWAKPAATPEV